MKIIVITLLIGLTLSLYSSGSAVVQLNSNNFQKEVVDSSDVWLIEFYGILTFI